MSLLAALALTLTAAAMEIQVAPDQPFPCVYLDDPLILEFRSDADVETRVALEAQREQEAPVKIDLGTFQVRGHGALWRKVSELPAHPGLYTLKFTVTTGDQSTTYERRFVWIERPFNGEPAPLVLGSGALDAMGLLAAQALPLRSVRLDAANGDAPRQAAAAKAVGFQVAVGLSTQEMPNPVVDAQNLVARLAGSASSWIIDPSGAPERLSGIVEGLRKANARPSISLIADDPGAIQALLAAAGQYDVREVVLRHAGPSTAEVRAFRDGVERSGYEGMPISVRIRPPEAPAAEWGPTIVRESLLCRAESVSATELSGYTLFTTTPEPGQTPGAAPGFAHLSAYIHRLRDAEAVGELSLGAGVRAPVFRNRGGWIIALWNENASGETTVPVGKATELRLTDTLNAPVEMPAAKDDALTISVGRNPVYLSGRDGSVVSTAASARAKTEAQAFVNNSAFRNAVPSEVLSIIQNLANAASPRVDHREFFALLRMFPYVEQRWQSGRLSRATAAPAIGALTRLCRALCVAEEEAKEPFVEPLQDMVSRASKSQSQYLTGTGSDGGSDRRGDWISAVVSELLADVEQLNDAGRINEAKAVASLAEWRALSLEAAAQGVLLSEAEPPLIEPPQEAAQEKPAQEKATKASSSEKSKGKTSSSKTSSKRTRSSR